MKLKLRITEDDFGFVLIEEFHSDVSASGFYWVEVGRDLAAGSYEACLAAKRLMEMP